MSELLTRPASKILLTTASAKRYVFVSGQSGRLNLPGGGREDGQTAIKALDEELRQELGIDLTNITSLEELNGGEPIRGRVTSKTGDEYVAEWTMYAGDLAIPFSELSIPEESDITTITALSPQQAMESTHISLLAVRAVALQHPAYIQNCL